MSITPRTKGLLGFSQSLPTDQKLYTTEQVTRGRGGEWEGRGGEGEGRGGGGEGRGGGLVMGEYFLEEGESGSR